jgi:hypothetical protein
MIDYSCCLYSLLKLIHALVLIYVFTMLSQTKTQCKEVQRDVTKCAVSQKYL